MSAKSAKRGENILDVEVSDVSEEGFGLRIGPERLRVSP
jgi:hypothetical protein